MAFITMSFEVFLRCFGEQSQTGIDRATVRSLFPVDESRSEPNYWRVCFDHENHCEIGVKPLAHDGTKLQSLYVHRPCGDIRLWNALLKILRLGSVVLWFAGSPSVLAEGQKRDGLPPDRLEGHGPPKFVSSAEELLQIVEEN
jgi:hypothetical protein